jgi:hypothetical protein
MVRHKKASVRSHSSKQWLQKHVSRCTLICYKTYDYTFETRPIISEWSNQPSWNILPVATPITEEQRTCMRQATNTSSCKNHGNLMIFDHKKALWRFYVLNSNIRPISWQEACCAVYTVLKKQTNVALQLYHHMHLCSLFALSDEHFVSLTFFTRSFDFTFQTHSRFWYNSMNCTIDSSDQCAVVSNLKLNTNTKVHHSINGNKNWNELISWGTPHTAQF